MKKINAGDTIGQAIVIESDDMDVFGNPKPDSYPLVMESKLNNSAIKTKEVAAKMVGGRCGRVLICKLVVVEEVLAEAGFDAFSPC